MKKILSVLLAALLTGTMAITASASWTPEEDAGNVKFGVQKANTAWLPDGEWSEGEYYEIDVKNTWVSAAVMNDEYDDAAKNLDFTLAMSWDEEAIYTYITFEDANGHDNTYGATPGDMWQVGAVQVSASDVDESGTSRLEYGIGVTSDTNEQISIVWNDYLSSGYTAPTDDFYVIADGNTMIYEIRTPFSAFSDVTPEIGAVYAVNYVLAWGNNNEYIHTQLASGCAGDTGKEVGLFAKVTMEEAPVIETVADTEAPSVAPQTFDAGVIAAVATVISAAGYAVSRKTR